MKHAAIQVALVYVLGMEVGLLVHLVGELFHPTRRFSSWPEMWRDLWEWYGCLAYRTLLWPLAFYRWIERRSLALRSYRLWLWHTLRGHTASVYGNRFWCWDCALTSGATPPTPEGEQE